MNLHLVDINQDLVDAWKSAFVNHQEVEIICSDIMSVAGDTIVSPANSTGNMGGGIDWVYANYFGPSLESTLKAEISKLNGHMLPVGQAILIPTGNRIIPYLISAPTMEYAQAVPADNCYKAMSAILALVTRNSNIISDIYCPGLATLTGGVPAEEAANKMAQAYESWKIE